MTATATAVAAMAVADEDVKRRVRFDAEADVRLLMAVVKHEPFAADHGSKLKVWDEVADEVYKTASKLRDVPSSRRAVTDRFHHLLVRYEQGTLKLKRWTDTPDEAALVLNLLGQITTRLAVIRSKKAKRTSTGGRSSISSLADLGVDSSRRRYDDGEGDDDYSSDDSQGSAAATEDGGDQATAEAAASSSVPGATPTTTDTKTKTDVSKRGRSSQVGSSSRSKRARHATAAELAFQEQLLSLKREKLELKRQKLELLRTQHADRMAIERERLELLVSPGATAAAVGSGGHRI